MAAQELEEVIANRESAWRLVKWHDPFLRFLLAVRRSTEVNRGQRRWTEMRLQTWRGSREVNGGQQRSTEVNTNQQQESTQVNRSQQKSTEVNEIASPNLEGVNTSQRRSTEVNKNAAPNLEGVYKGQQRSTEVNRSLCHLSHLSSLSFSLIAHLSLYLSLSLNFWILAISEIFNSSNFWWVQTGANGCKRLQFAILPISDGCKRLLTAANGGKRRQTGLNGSKRIQCDPCPFRES